MLQFLTETAVDRARAKMAAALAAQLSRQHVACSFTADEIGEDALAWVMIADRCRATPAANGRRALYLKATADLADKYRAHSVIRGDEIGIRFLSGLYNRSRGNLFVL